MRSFHGGANGGGEVAAEALWSSKPGRLRGREREWVEGDERGGEGASGARFYRARGGPREEDGVGGLRSERF